MGSFCTSVDRRFAWLSYGGGMALAEQEHWVRVRVSSSPYDEDHIRNEADCEQCSDGAPLREEPRDLGVQGV